MPLKSARKAGLMSGCRFQAALQGRQGEVKAAGFRGSCKEGSANFRVQTSGNSARQAGPTSGRRFQGILQGRQGKLKGTYWKKTCKAGNILNSRVQD